MEYIEINECSGEGYKPMVRFENWRVSLINYAEGFDKSNFSQMERHHLTDEVFILLEGKAQLIIGGNEQRLGPLKSCEMKRKFTYNIKKDVWHHIFVSRDACVIVVENENTSIENTEYTKILNDNF